MAVSWVISEMATADLKDQRLNNRLREVLSQLAERPTVSIPAACGGHTEMTAAYRLFDNDNATFEAVLQPHIDATRERIAPHQVVLVVQDTTEIDVTRPGQQMAGAGPLDGGARWGTLLHPLHAFTPDGTPLGTLHAKTWVRDETSERCASRSRGQRAATPIEEKESHRWVDAYRRAIEESKRCPSTQLVCLADSEADIYELLVEATIEPSRVDWIIRACQNRA